VFHLVSSLLTLLLLASSSPSDMRERCKGAKGSAVGCECVVTRADAQWFKNGRCLYPGCGHPLSRHVDEDPDGGAAAAGAEAAGDIATAMAAQDGVCDAVGTALLSCWELLGWCCSGCPNRAPAYAAALRAAAEARAAEAKRRIDRALAVEAAEAKGAGDKPVARSMTRETSAGSSSDEDDSKRRASRSSLAAAGAGERSVVRARRQHRRAGASHRADSIAPAGGDSDPPP
jgi:hypothetical protein